VRSALLIPALLALAACAGQAKRATYTCPNGPTLAVVYTDDGATIAFPDGRVELLPPTGTPDVYAKPGLSWNAAAFRTARLDDGPRSYGCNQMAG
jgi:hypothetical protein